MPLLPPVCTRGGIPIHSLARVILVLYQPSDISNVGAVVRAMSNFGLCHLRLVEPAAFDPQRIQAMAHQAEDLVAAVQRYNTLDQALADCGLVLATSRRPRVPYRERHDPQVAARALLASAARHPDTPPVLLFGREEDGLPKAALDRCSAVVTIPTAARQKSLNLGQAVMIMAYELWRAANLPTASGGDPLPNSLSQIPRLASDTEREAIFTGLTGLVTALQPKIQPAQLAHAVGRLRAVLLRATPTPEEAALLARLFTQAAQRLGRSGRVPPDGQPDADHQGSAPGGTSN